MVTCLSPAPSAWFPILICAPDICRISLILLPWRPITQPISWGDNRIQPEARPRLLGPCCPPSNYPIPCSHRWEPRTPVSWSVCQDPVLGGRRRGIRCDSGPFLPPHVHPKGAVCPLECALASFCRAAHLAPCWVRQRGLRGPRAAEAW